MSNVAPMTTVTCSACTQIIVAETDRVYCFGGCKQILHLRCSELRPSDSSTLRNNIALKYMCFACGKKQICLNDLRSKYSELLERMDDVCVKVSKYESILNQLETNLLGKIEASLMSTVGSKIESLFALRSAMNDCPTYATVARGSDNRSVNTNAATIVSSMPTSKKIKPGKSTLIASENVDDGWILRPGKRRAKSTANGNYATAKNTSDNEQLTNAKRSSNLPSITSSAGKKFES